MVVGKPDININSYGITYFQKADNDEDDTGNGIEIPKVDNTIEPPKPNIVKPKHTKDTKYVFNSELNPKSLSISQRKLLEDSNESKQKDPKPDSITGLTSPKKREYPTEGLTANTRRRTGGSGKTEDITEVPDPSKRGGKKEELFNVKHTRPEGYKTPKGETAERIRQSKLMEEKKPEEKKPEEKKVKQRQTSTDEGKKRGSRMVGNAPSEVKNTTEQVHSGKKVRVGVGSKAKEIFDKREGVGAVHEETSNPKTVVDKPDKELNTITSKENKRLRDHNAEMDKFLSDTKFSDEQKREYNAIPERKDGKGVDYDAQRAYVRNLTGKKSKKGEKIEQTKEEKETERKQQYSDRMAGMKERAQAAKETADEANRKFHKDVESKSKLTTSSSPIKGNKKENKDNPKSSKAPPEEIEPDKITTDKKEDKISAIASKLAQIKDPKEREERKRQLTGQKESEEIKEKIEAARKEVEAAKKKKETTKKKKEVPKGQMTPEQLKAYRAEREANKDIKTKSNDIIMTMNVMKLDLMKDAMDGEGGNTTDGFGDSDEWNLTFATDRALTREEGYMDDYKGDEEPTGTTMTKLNEVEDIQFQNPEQADKHLNAPNMTKKQPIKPTTITDVNTHKIPTPKTGKSPKDLGKSADETIFKAISLKLDLISKKSPKIKLTTSTNNWNERKVDPNDVEFGYDQAGKKTATRIDWKKREEEQAEDDHWDSYGRDL